MTPDFQSFGIDRLSVSQRWDLIDFIIAGMPEQVDPSEISEEQMSEILRRRREADQNPGAGRHWREVIADLRKQP